MMIPSEFAGDITQLEGNPVAGMLVLRELVKQWHPELLALFEEADPRNSGIGALRMGDPVRPWPTRSITLLGDAAHPAPPGGLGANLAFLDAELLCRKLVEARAGSTELIPALADYERQMCAYAAKALGYAEEVYESFDEMRRRANPDRIGTNSA